MGKNCPISDFTALYLPYTDLVPPSTDSVPLRTNLYRLLLTQYHHVPTSSAPYWPSSTNYQPVPPYTVPVIFLWPIWWVMPSILGLVCVCICVCPGIESSPCSLVPCQGGQVAQAATQVKLLSTLDNLSLAPCQHCQHITFFKSPEFYRLSAGSGFRGTVL